METKPGLLEYGAVFIGGMMSISYGSAIWLGLGMLLAVVIGILKDSLSKIK